MNFSQGSLQRKTFIIIISLVGVAAVYLPIRYLISRGSVPQAFNDARRKSVEIASGIVLSSNDSLKTLDLIAEKDRDYDFPEALDLVYKEQLKVDEAKIKAIELTKQLNKMAEAVPLIKPREAGNLALTAVSEEVSLVGRLIIYNSYFSGLLETLRLKFSGDIRYDASDVQMLIQNMNKEANEINRLNNSFNDKVKEFDKIINESQKFF